MENTRFSLNQLQNNNIYCSLLLVFRAEIMKMDLLGQLAWSIRAAQFERAGDTWDEEGQVVTLSALETHVIVLGLH